MPPRQISAWTTCRLPRHDAPALMSEDRWKGLTWMIDWCWCALSYWAVAAGGGDAAGGGGESGLMFDVEGARGVFVGTLIITFGAGSRLLGGFLGLWLSLS